MTKHLEKLDYKKTALIGFGFFAVSIAWSMYNANVPLMLEKFVSSTTLIGLIMSIDNVFAVLLQPLFGALSDKTHTKWGRRIPYILIGIPLSVVFFVLIPFCNAVWSIMAAVILFNFTMSIWRTPVIALMPDTTPPRLRSRANGVINLMGGIGSILAFILGGLLFELGGMPLPFLFSGLIMMAAWFILLLCVKEPPLLPEAYEAFKKDHSAEDVAASKEDEKGVTLSLILILFAIFFWFTSINSIETYFTLYASNVLNVKAGDAMVTLAFFAVAFVVSAVPAGIIGTKFGRKKTIMIGLIGLVLLLSIAYFLRDIWIIRFCLVLAGLFWGLVNINSLPMVVEIAKSSKIGKYTGYYYFFSQAASIASPLLFGLIHDLTKNYSNLFIYSPIGIFLAILCMIFVRHGEAPVDEEELKAEVEALSD